MHGSKALLVALLGVVVLAGACSSEPKPTPEPLAVDEVTGLPDTCTSAGALPPGGQVSFVKENRVYVVSPTGAGTRCVITVTRPEPIQWGPVGDRFLVAAFDHVDVYSDRKPVTIGGPGGHARLQGWSRPTGKNVVFISSDGRKLVKSPFEGGDAIDISFLSRHDEVAYHPSGAQIAVIGQTRDGRYGIFLATNEGKKATEVVPVSNEDSFYGVTYSHDGNTLYYIADLHDSWEMRSLDLSGVLGGSRPETLFSAPTPVTTALVSPLTGTVYAYRQGNCESGFQSYVRDDRGARRVGAGLGDTQPVGWLSDGTLVLAASRDLCDLAATRDLYVVHGGRQAVLVRGVDQAAVRTAAPPPGPVPQEIAGEPSAE